MAAFTSQRSIRVISELHPDLAEVHRTVVKWFDHSPYCGARTTAQQMAEFKKGASKIDGINQISKHQIFEGRPLALASDSVPYPLPGNDWENRPLFTAYAYAMLGVGWEKGIELRWGGDWDGDHQWEDQEFHDLPHIELIGNQYL